MKVLVTGGSGYIGAHVLMELTKRGVNYIDVIDKKLTTSPNDISYLATNTYDGDILSEGALSMLRKDYDAIIHLAAYISVEESVKEPVKYWRNNLLSTSKIIDHAKGAHLIFASTGTAFNPNNPYAYSKLACELEIIKRLKTNYTNFRFYNVSGMHYVFKPTGEATHLIRRAAMAARGLIPELTVFGNDWDTLDGTCVRDYIHVKDLAASIVNAVFEGPANTPYECLGTGDGYTVMQVIQSMKKVSNTDFKVNVSDKRPGDVGSMICDSQYKHIRLHYNLDDMCKSAYETIGD
jgi:UDP-glucose 4-epimerase